MLVYSTRMGTTPLTKIRQLLTALGWLLFCLPPARAHDPGLSSATVTRSPSSIDVSIAWNEQDAQLVGVGLSPDARLLVPSIWEFSADGAPVPVETAGVTTGENRDLVLRMRYPAGNARAFEARSLAFERLSRGHRQFITVNDAGGQLVTSALLSAENRAVTFPGLGSPSPTPGEPATSGAGAFFLLGLEHIFTGYDHLLFLLALLLVCPTFRAAALIISCFTLAHSLTLALAAMEIVQLPSRLVEAVIAGSIIYVGAENLLRRKAMPNRWLLTTAFGLVHGLGFATALREARIGTHENLPAALISFNLGVEAGQLLIAALVLPLLFAARNRPSFQRRLLPIASALICLAGTWWIIERTIL